ncbi:MAG: adenylosuccinate lyase [Candidatus Eisenbacteria bacterium]|uniref:Adenylosuccinate lyase n=1 Tax=Eiseniibacteriota bacterium TaxID=2212470 RepID=A0A849SF89_UNCEI|nr:adenylosuccinate lyase [Candidatus Eisenbacteria bacterium]
MIERYARPAMAKVWSDARRLERWLEVELAATAVRERRGEVPAGSVARIRASARIDVARMDAIEAQVRHDVIAFLSMVAETVGDDARHLHVGMTSSDLVDTALALQIAEAGAGLTGEVSRLRRTVYALAQTHRRTPMIGRSHGVHAEPITFGLKCLLWSEELGRAERRLAAALADCAVGKFSGAVGTLAHLDAALESEALASLGLVPEPIANQVVQRDRHAALLAMLAVLGGTLEKIALEIRHLQRTEVREVEEPFELGQKGSSAMPHKRNPVRCERVCGLARLLRAHAAAGFENQALWHERDISHSSVERVIFPDAFLVADFMAAELESVLAGLVVHAPRMRSNLEAGGGIVHSQRVLLALVAAGLARDEAYRVVQRHALAALDGAVPFRAGLESDPEVRARLDGASLAACFDLEHHLRSVDALFARAGVPAS